MTKVSPVWLREAWSRFWFAPIAAHSLALLRVCFGATLFLKCCGGVGLSRLGSVRLVFPDRSMWEYPFLRDTWKMTYPGLDWLPQPTPFMFARLEDTLLICSVLLTVGLATRVVAPLTALLFSYLFFLSQWNFHHHLYLFLIVLWVLACSRCALHFSLDAVLRSPERHDESISAWPVRMVQVLVCTVYISSFLWKLNTAWFDGDILRILEGTGSLHGSLIFWARDLVGYRTLSVTALLLEGLVPLMIVFKPTRRWAILCGIALHVGIDLVVDVGTFGYQMLALYVVFLFPRAGSTVVLFDGFCGMCRGSRRWANLLDWFRRVTWKSFRDPAVRALVPQLTDEQLETEMYVFTPAGRALPGFAGWRHLLASFPLTFVPSFLLYVPPINWIGDRVYKFVAARRAVACVIPSAPQEADAAWRQTLSVANSTAPRDTIEQ